jgi:hypothetical protein
VLLLEAPLRGPPPGVVGVAGAFAKPALEMEVRLEEGPDVSAPVGDTERGGELALPSL